MQLETLKDVLQRGEEKRIDMDSKLASLADAVNILTRQMSESAARQSAVQQPAALDTRALDRVAEGQERIVALLGQRTEETAAGGVDSETRMRLRNIDVQLLRILEEMSAGRQDSVAELRTELAGLAEAIRNRQG